MADLSSLLGPVLQGPALQQISSAIGADEQQTRTAATAALPLLLGQMQRNVTTPQGAQSLDRALERDHDGGLLESLTGSGGLGGMLGGLLGSAHGGQAPSRATDGAGILGHVFGQRQEPAAEGVARAAGLERGQALKLMAMVVPLVMAWLGRQKRQQGAGPGELAGLLGGASQQARQQTPAGVLGALGDLLDRDGDGDFKDELLGQVGGLFGKR